MIYVPKGRRFQRGNLNLFPAGTTSVAGAAGDVVTLSGATANAFAFMSNATAEIFFQTSGIVQRRLNGGSLLQLSASTDWIIPNGSSPGTYRCRHTNPSGDAFNFVSAAVNVYRAFTVGAYEIQQFDSSPTAGGQSTTCTIEIDDGSVSQDTGSYTVSADREDF